MCWCAVSCVCSEPTDSLLTLSPGLNCCSLAACPLSSACRQRACGTGCHLLTRSPTTDPSAAARYIIVFYTISRMLLPVHYNGSARPKSEVDTADASCYWVMASRPLKAVSQDGSKEPSTATSLSESDGTDKGSGNEMPALKPEADLHGPRLAHEVVPLLPGGLVPLGWVLPLVLRS